VSDLEAALLDEVEHVLAGWRTEYADDPDREREQLLLLALEREQIAAVAYREEAVVGRVDALDLAPEIRALIRQTLVWIWKDEELHTAYLRGLLLGGGSGGAGRRVAGLVIYGRQLQGVLSGWVTSTRNHLDAREAPLRTGAAGLLVAAAGVTGRIPPRLRRELRFQTFKHYCDVNVALEATAELSYRRVVELAAGDEELAVFSRVLADEGNHRAAFRVISDALTEDDRLAPGCTYDALLTDLAAISEWFVPAALREVGAPDDRPRAFGSGAAVAVGGGSGDSDKMRVLEECLDRAGLDRLAVGATSVAIRASFMLGYDRADPSNVNDPELVEGLARYLRQHGVTDVAVLEAPTVYETCFEHRSVAEVAAYFGFTSDAYRVVDISADLRPFTFGRGFVQQAVSGAWLDADLRIVMPKLRTDPTEFAHLSLSTLEGSTGAIGETFYASRRVDFRSATMMLLDAAPPDFAVVDAWAPVADGPFGVMGCRHPAQVRYVYAGADALAVDEVVLADLGVPDARLAPIVRRAHHWFGLAPTVAAVDGIRPDLHAALRGAHASVPLRMLGRLSYPIYMYLSDDGQRFVPALDPVAFPPSAPVGWGTRVVRGAAQRAFGLRPERRT
jgi:Domain of unknown function (DUF362)